jgi:predicted transposase YdaD
MQRKMEHDRVSNINGDREEGEQIGLQKGEENKALEIARNALAKGSSPEFVHDITGLDVETIQGLGPA